MTTIPHSHTALGIGFNAAAAALAAEVAPGVRAAVTFALHGTTPIGIEHTVGIVYAMARVRPAWMDEDIELFELGPQSIEPLPFAHLWINAEIDACAA